MRGISRLLPCTLSVKHLVRNSISPKIIHYNLSLLKSQTIQSRLYSGVTLTREDVNKRVLKTLSFFDKVHIVAPPVTNNNILASIYKNSQDQNLNKDESHTPSISSEISTEKQLDDVKIMPDLNTEWVQMGLDSLDVVEVMIALEEEFHMEIPDAVADSAKTPKEIAKYIYDFIYPRESETSSSPLEEPLVDSESEFKQ